MKKTLKLLSNLIGFTGLWTALPIYFLEKQQMFPVTTKQAFYMTAALSAWIILNNLWSIACEGKKFSEFQVGDGLIPDTGLKKDSPQKRAATYPKIPVELISKNPEGIILGCDKDRYVRIKNQILHSCIVGGSGSGKTSTVILDTLLANYSAPEPEMLTFCIDVKGELHEKATKKDDPAIYVVDPSDRRTTGWDAWYRLHGNPTDDLIVESMEEIAEALIVSTNPKDMFFVVNARSMFTGLLVYYFKKGESFIDAVNHILESDAKKLIEEIIEESVKSDLWYQYLAKFAGKKAESVEDCMVEMTTNLSVFSKSDVKFCFRDNVVKASPSVFKENKSIFLAIPEHLLGSYQAIMRLCTAQVLQDLQRRPDADAAAKPILVLIDEFARLGRVETIFNALATLRSKKTMVMLAFQSMAQMEVIYSKEEARVIADNCRIKVICECADPDTAKDISAWCGNYQNKKETLNGGKNRSKSYTYEEKPIVEQGDLITLIKKEEVILIISGIGYLRPKKCYYFKDRKISSLADQVREFNQRR